VYLVIDAALLMNKHRRKSCEHITYSRVAVLLVESDARRIEGTPVGAPVDGDVVQWRHVFLVGVGADRRRAEGRFELFEWVDVQTRDASIVGLHQSQQQHGGEDEDAQRHDSAASNN